MQMKVWIIRILNNKKIILYFSILLIANFLVLIPATIGYGSSFNDAQIITNVIYYETLASYDEDAYYIVYCRPGDDLEVSVEISYPTYDIDLYLYDDYEWIEDSDTYSDSYHYIYAEVYSRTYYYIHVERQYPISGSLLFTLTITGATGTPGIPRFEIISILIVTISMISLIYFRMKRKK